MSVDKIELTSEEEFIEVGRRQQLKEVIAENVSTAITLAAIAALFHIGIDNSDIVTLSLNRVVSFAAEMGLSQGAINVDPTNVRNSLSMIYAFEVGGSVAASLSAVRHGLRLIPRN